ncbi:hypothetical protein T484DRAFT_2296390 [Baffinella frigidus]|nr:hypothetical protein T484DRAFT_2296390 [Cryptophyta sp. CCMP2293]
MPLRSPTVLRMPNNSIRFPRSPRERGDPRLLPLGHHWRKQGWRWRRAGACTTTPAPPLQPAVGRVL